MTAQTAEIAAEVRMVMDEKRVRAETTSKPSKPSRL